MKREAIALGSSVVVASLVCLVPSASAAEVADPKPTQADSTNDFSATRSTRSSSTSGTTSDVHVGLNGAYNNDAKDMR